MFSKATSETRSYRGDYSQIEFFPNDNGGLAATVVTDDLYMRSVVESEDEYDRYAQLYGDINVMKTLTTGVTKRRDEIATRIRDTWVKRWNEHDPYSGLAIFDLNRDDFRGHIVLAHGDHPGEAELSYLFHKAYWGTGYGSEAARAIVQEYAPATVDAGYLLDGKPLEKIVATSKTTNFASCKILSRKVGMRHTHCASKYGAWRNHYEITLSEILKKSTIKAVVPWSWRCTIL